MKDDVPKCKSNMIIDIVYGFPSRGNVWMMQASNKINLGGCKRT